MKLSSNADYGDLFKLRLSSGFYNSNSNEDSYSFFKERPIKSLTRIVFIKW